MLLGVSGVFRGVPGCSEGVPGLFRGVPGCSGVFRVLQTPLSTARSGSSFTFSLT